MLEYLWVVVLMAGLAVGGALVFGTQREGPGTKRTVAAMAAAGVWAVVTLFVFVPAGGLWGFLVTDESLVAGLAVCAIAISGIVHAFSLFFAVGALRAAAPDMRARLKRSAAYGAAHHVAVFLVCTLALVATSFELTVAFVLSVPCLMGLGVSWLLHAAATAKATEVA